LEEKEHKREMDGAKEKERYKEKYMGKSIQELDLSDCKHMRRNQYEESLFRCEDDRYNLCSFFDLPILGIYSFS
jgi:paired amphipathic helix protein Sin3a